KGKHIITVSTEHKAVLDTCKDLERKGFEVTYLPVQSSGLIDLEELKQAIRTDTLLVSVMYVNMKQESFNLSKKFQKSLTIKVLCLCQIPHKPLAKLKLMW